MQPSETKVEKNIFAVPTLNSIQYFSCFQLQFTNYPFIGMKPGEVLKVPQTSLGKSMLLAVKYGLISMCHRIAVLLCKATVFLCCSWFLDQFMLQEILVLYHCITLAAVGMDAVIIIINIVIVLLLLLKLLFIFTSLSCFQQSVPAYCLEILFVLSQIHSIHSQSNNQTL